MFDVGNNAATQEREDLSKSSMSPKGDTQLPTSMSPHAVTQSQPVCHPVCHPVGDTNQKEQELIKTLNVNGFKKSLSEAQPENESLPAAEEIRVGSLVLEMLEVCRDKHSRGFYRLVAQNVPEELIRAALSETKYQDRMGRITKSRGAFFTDQLQRLAREREMRLGLKILARDRWLNQNSRLKPDEAGKPHSGRTDNS